ncbi:CHASE domain-containing protein [Mariprofundus sp. EBB-1]|uniref:CHASE domain-containing protein n=1 Tax=Mariprofundus sp. EBB-1 TaxID=2650971 RepID=UPI00137A6128|nr:CHASE domain-containing protein [Mariprofundus sp. EBB-1]
MIVSLLVLAASLIVTYASFNLTRATTEQTTQAYFDFRVREAIKLIETRIAAYEEVLRGAGAMFKASENVTRDEFKRYISSLRLADYYPGIQGVGFSLFIPPESKNSHVDTIRSEGFPTYSIYPEGERETYSSIIYLEPFSDRNLRAFGYDMFSEPVRHSAMQRAIDNDMIVMSGKVRLVQESGKNEQAGFLMYNPIYARGKPHTLLADRQKNFIGWAYSAFRMNDFMNGVDGEHAGDLDIQIYDGDTISNESLMFDSDGSIGLGESLNTNGLIAHRINIADHFWNVLIRPLAFFEMRVNTAKPLLVASVGAIASFALTLIVWLLMTGRERAIRAAKAMNADLMIEKQRLGSIIDGTHVGTWEWDIPSGKVVFNDYWAQIIGYTLSELEPISIESWVKYTHPDDLNQSNELLKKHFSGDLPYYECEARMRHKNGDWVWVLDRGKVTTWTTDGKPLLMFGTHQDITQRKVNDEQYLQTQKMKSLGTLIGGIAHEFNNALAGMTGNIYLARKKVANMPDVVSKLDTIEKLAFKSADLIKSMLSFAQKGVIDKTTFDLPSFIKETITVHRRSLPENIGLKLDIEEAPVLVSWDANILQQVVLNLINNARDALTGSTAPSIKIRLSSFSPDAAFLEKHSDVEPGRFSCLSISDNGMGINAEELPHIFEPFYTTKEVGQGTGLGLSMVIGAIQSHQGCIEVESSEGKGSTFSIYLPQEEVEEIASLSQSETVLPHGAGETVLLADDDPSLLDTGKELLESLGYRVLTAEDGLQAVDVFKAHKGEVSLVITDIMMPRLGGAEAAKLIHEIDPEIKIIFATGYSKDEERIAHLDSNVPILHKPYNINDFSRIIRDQLDNVG